MAEQEREFNPAGHLMDLKGKSYLPVAARVVWFREDHPIESGWAIRPRCEEGGFKEGYARYVCDIVDPEGRIIATGTNAEDKQGFVDFVMKAETGAIGRALASCGYGTMAAMDEGEIVDTPIQRGAVQKPAQSQRTGAPAAGQQSRARGSSAPVGATPSAVGEEAGALGAGPDAAEMAPVEHWCDGCGVKIEGVETKKGPVSVASIVQLSTQRWGRKLCHACGKTRMQAEQVNVPAGQIA